LSAKVRAPLLLGARHQARENNIWTDSIKYESLHRKVIHGKQQDESKIGNDGRNLSMHSYHLAAKMMDEKKRYLAQQHSDI